MDFVVAKIRDKIRAFERNGIVSNTNFLTPAEMSEALIILRGYEFSVLGGFEEAERKIVVVGSEEADVSEFCGVVRITPNSGKKLSHRDVLGGILGLGIKREMIGDILISESSCDVVIMNEMLEYILNNLDSVGREKVSVVEIDFNSLACNISEKEERNINVASLRVDAVVSVVFGISREESSKLIGLEKVLINFLPCKNNSKALNVDDLVSVRGHGRFKVLEVTGKTGKGRLKLKIEW